MTEKRIGIIGTVIFHNVILLILLLFYLSTPIPVSSGGGILIDFGDTELAGGVMEPSMNEVPEVQAAATQQKDNETEEDILTQDFEEAPAVEKKPEKKTEVKKTVTKPAETKPKETEKPTETKPQVNNKALYSGKGKAGQEDSKSQGIYKGDGNQGNPDGTPGANNYGQGSGTGLGIQVGGGLSNRKYLALPKPEFKVQREGKVVVEVTVNREGKVISATPGVKGTTIVDANLYAAAKKAALESKFVTLAEAQAFQTQTGTITYHFKLE